MQHHLGTKLFKGGVYDPTKTVETFSRGKESTSGGRWKCGQSQHEIGRALWQATSHHSQDIVACGGIAPPARRRSRLSLTLAEREDISRGIASDSSIREIARLLKRSASTVSRGGRSPWWSSCLSCPRLQIARHGCRRCARSVCLLAGNRRLRDVVASKLMLDWSPEQISGWLKTRYPTREYARVPRDYLSQPVHSSARSIEERADGPPAVEAAHAPLASCQRTWTLPGADRRCHLNSRATRGGGRPSDFPATGKAICWPVERTAILRRWWSGIHGFSC